MYSLGTLRESNKYLICKRAKAAYQAIKDTNKLMKCKKRKKSKIGTCYTMLKLTQ